MSPLKKNYRGFCRAQSRCHGNGACSLSSVPHVWCVSERRFHVCADKKLEEWRGKTEITSSLVLLRVHLWKVTPPDSNTQNLLGPLRAAVRQRPFHPDGRMDKRTDTGSPASVENQTFTCKYKAGDCGVTSVISKVYSPEFSVSWSLSEGHVFGVRSGRHGLSSRRRRDTKETRVGDSLWNNSCRIKLSELYCILLKSIMNNLEPV